MGPALSSIQISGTVVIIEGSFNAAILVVIHRSSYEYYYEWCNIKNVNEDIITCVTVHISMVYRQNPRLLDTRQGTPLPDGK